MGCSISQYKRNPAKGRILFILLLIFKCTTKPVFLRLSRRLYRDGQEQLHLYLTFENGDRGIYETEWNLDQGTARIYIAEIGWRNESVGRNCFEKGFFRRTSN